MRSTRRWRAGRLAVVAVLCAPVLACALTVESCVSADVLMVGSADRQAWLDDDDLHAASEAIAARFPMLQRDGFAPSRLLLWDRPGGGWIYVAVIENPERAGDVCFTATISAGALPITKTLRKKYFPERDV